MKVEFSEHAIERARSRFPQLGLKAIACEIADAVAAGRLSDEPPSWRMGIHADTPEPIEYAWNAGRSRIYVLSRRRGERFCILVTCIHGPLARMA